MRCLKIPFYWNWPTKSTTSNQDGLCQLDWNSKRALLLGLVMCNLFSGSCKANLSLKNCFLDTYFFAIRNFESVISVISYLHSRSLKSFLVLLKAASNVCCKDRLDLCPMAFSLSCLFLNVFLHRLATSSQSVDIVIKQDVSDHF